MNTRFEVLNNKEWIVASIAGVFIGFFTRPVDIEIVAFGIVLSTFIIRKIYGGKYGTDFDRMDILWVLAMLIFYTIGIMLRRILI